MASSAQNVTFASYNIHRAVGLDGQRNTLRIAAVIDGLDAGIVALQEVEWGLPAHDAWLERYAERRGYTLMADATIEDHRGHYGNVLLSRYPVLSFERIDLGVPRFEPRAAIAARVSIGGASCHVIATHLGLRARERRWQSARLAEYLSGDGRGPAVLLGDLNEWRWGSRSIRPLTALFDKAPSPRSFPAGRPLFALDRIMFSGIADRPHVRADVRPLARIASDHRPVVAHCRLGDSVTSAS